MPKDDYDYGELLQRARKDLPNEIAYHERFQIPDVKSFQEGNTTIVTNFAEIASLISREPDDILKYLLRELGTAGERDEGRILLKGRIGSRKIQEKFEDYVGKYVLCSECDKPDTRLVKEGRITLLKCDACGAHRPIRGRKKRTRMPPADDIEHGGTYDLFIQDIGREGDGMARVGSFTIYVPGTTKGDRVKVRIDHVKGTLAFGTVVGKVSK